MQWSTALAVDGVSTAIGWWYGMKQKLIREADTAFFLSPL